MTPIRILIVDDHAMFREGLRAVLQDETDMDIVGEAGDGAAALAMARQLRPAVVLMDLNLPDRNGVDVTRDLVALDMCLKIIALTIHDDDDMISAMIRAGSCGFMLKDAHAQELLQAIRAVAHGGAATSPAVAMRLFDLYRQAAAHECAGTATALTARDRDMLRLLAAGDSTCDVADKLGLAPQTVKNNLSRAYRKLGVTNRAEAIAVAARRGLLAESSAD